MNEKKVNIIAEIGNNHNGDIGLAKEMICSARDCGADIVKFQMRSLNTLYRKNDRSRNEDLGSEYIQDLLEKYDLSVEQHYQLFEFCRQERVKYLCTPWDINSLKVLQEWGVKQYKVASADLTNIPLIDAIISTGCHFYLSTGMSYQWEIEQVIKRIEKKTENFTVLHCNSTYPAPFTDINLKYLLRLKTLHSKFGYSGHERGIAVSIGAVALGATTIERHFTFNRQMEGPDHAASLEPDAFSELCSGIRELSAALGDGEPRCPTQGELINRENLAKSIVAKNNIKAGKILSNDDLEIKSPGQGLSPLYLDDIIGSTARRTYEPGDFFYLSDIKPKSKFDASTLDFGRNWGVPVRFHDVQKFYQIFKPQFLEFHLSYQDLNLEPSDYLEGIKFQTTYVHAPELFMNSKLLDLASDDPDELQLSIENLKIVISHTNKINQCLNITGSTGIIANIGGHTMDNVLSESEKENRYNIFADTIKLFKSSKYEILPQTMAPFPWHFGGQRHQNLFILPDEIKYYCKKMNLRMCLDISHSKLACNYYKIDFYRFLEEVAPFTAYIHFGDAAGLNGEGLQIGAGEINFARVFEILDDKCPEAPFIPEIWQGHKDFGEGFKVALSRLLQLRTSK